MNPKRLIALFMGLGLLAGCGIVKQIDDDLHPFDQGRVSAQQAKDLRTDPRVQALTGFDPNYRATLYRTYRTGPSKGKTFVRFNQCNDCDNYSFQVKTKSNERPDFWFEAESLPQTNEPFQLKSGNPTVRFWVPPNPDNSIFCTYNDPNFLTPQGLTQTKAIAAALDKLNWIDAEIAGHIWECNNHP